MISFFLVIGYVLLGILLIKKLKFFTIAQIDKKTLIAIFLLKVLAGISYIYLFESYYASGDTWGYFKQGVMWQKTLWTEPQIFLKLVFGSNPGYGIPEELTNYFYPGHHIYWNNNGSNFMCRFTAIVSIITFNKFYPIAVFTAFLSFIGLTAIYKTFVPWYNGNKWYLIISILLVPTVVFFTSGVHKEAFMSFFIGIILYHLTLSLNGRLKFWRVLIIVAACLLVSFIRSYLLLMLIPALLAYIISKYVRLKPFYVYCIIYLLVASTALFLIENKNINFRLYENLIVKQTQFQWDVGNSSVYVKPLKPTTKSFITAIPNALQNTLLRPFPKDANALIKWLVLIEVNLVLLFMLFAIIKSKLRLLRLPSIAVFALFFSLSVFVIIGYIVPNLGAIVRYKAVVLPLFIAALVFLSSTSNKKMLVKTP